MKKGHRLRSCRDPGGLLPCDAIRGEREGTSGDTRHRRTVYGRGDGRRMFPDDVTRRSGPRWARFTPPGSLAPVACRVRFRVASSWSSPRWRGDYGKRPYGRLTLVDQGYGFVTTRSRVFSSFVSVWRAECGGAFVSRNLDQGKRSKDFSTLNTNIL